MGRRKVGKTSLLLEFERSLAEPSIRFVIIDAFEHAPVSVEIFRRYAARTLDAIYGHREGVSFEAQLAMAPARYRAALASSAALATLPQELRSIVLELADVPLNAGSIKLLLDLPERLAEAEGIHLILGWDEFQKIVTWSGRSRPKIDILALMRSTWQRHRRVAYIVSGSAPSVLREMISSSSSPFFQHFSIVEVGEMARPNARALLTTGGISTALAERAVDVFGGQPFYLQMLGEELTASGEPGDETALKEAIQRLLFNRTGRLALFFEREFHAQVGNSALLAHLLEALAQGGPDGSRLVDLARAIKSPSGATRGYLERLGDAVIQTEASRYHLADRVYGLWLRWRAPAGAAVPMSVIGNEAEQAAALALARLGFEVVYQSRASRGAFDLLAIRATHSLAVQVKRSSLPLSFDLESWARMEAEAKRHQWRWVVAQAAPDGTVTWLEPARARKGKSVRIGSDAAIQNLLLWLD